MYAEEDTFRLCESSKLDQLREKVEEWQIDEDNQTLMLAIAKHVPISFTLKLRIEGCCEENDSFIALMLLQISLPPKYPLHGSAPDFHIVWFIVVDPLETCNANKPLETLGYCDELKLKDTIKREAEGQLLPDPCVYELATTWLSEHLKEYVTLSPHARK